MSRIEFLIDRIGRLRRSLEPKVRAVKWLPTVFLNEDGQDVAGAEEANARARRYAELRGISVKEYSFVAEDGIEL